MAYALENAVFQWEEGERRARERPELQPVVDRLLEELRRRLGSTFSLEELAGFYAAGTDWAGAVPGDAVDSAFNRYSREAADYGGRRPG